MRPSVSARRKTYGMHIAESVNSMNYLISLVLLDSSCSAF